MTRFSYNVQSTYHFHANATRELTALRYFERLLHVLLVIFHALLKERSRFAPVFPSTKTSKCFVLCHKHRTRHGSLSEAFCNQAPFGGLAWKHIVQGLFKTQPHHHHHDGPLPAPGIRANVQAVFQLFLSWGSCKIRAVFKFSQSLSWSNYIFLGRPRAFLPQCFHK